MTDKLIKRKTDGHKGTKTSKKEQGYPQHMADRRAASRPTNPAQSAGMPTRKLNGNDKTAINDESNVIMSTPLTYQETATMIRREAVEVQREMKAEMSFETIHDTISRQKNTAEAEIITSPPNTELTDIEEVHKDARDKMKLVTAKTNQDMANQDSRGQQ